MSSLTEEWILRTSENKVRYFIDIRNFDQKIKQFKRGRYIVSKQFKIGSTEVQIQLQPVKEEFEDDEDSSDSRHVSIFIHNMSDWRVKVKANFTVRSDNSHREYSDYFSPTYIQPMDGFGHRRFIPHDRCRRNDLLRGDGVLELMIDVELLEEEVLPSKDLIKNETEKNIEKVNKEMKEVKKKVESLEALISTEMKEMKTMLSNQSMSKNQPKMDCPVCCETIKPPMRLKQCEQGHIICEDCFQKTFSRQTQAGIVVAEIACFVCKFPVRSRPTALKQLLGLI